MSGPTDPTQAQPETVAPPSGWLGPLVALVITGALLAGTVIYQGYHAYIAFDRDDTNHLETPLLLATARQLSDGPSTLYGPFSGSNPLVLIHAPFYYRLAAAMAWPMARAGTDPILASLIAARGLAFIGFMLTVLSATWVAQIDRGAAIAGVWSALLLAGSPVFGSFGFTVRPDTLGIAFQTIGFGLALRALRDGSSAGALGLIACGVMFGLAACAKQHLLVAAAVATLLVLVAMVRARMPRGSGLAMLAGMVVVPVAYYAWEEWVTGGQMSRSVFLVPSRLHQAPSDGWKQVAKVFFEVAKLGAGSLCLALAILFARARAFRGTKLDAALWLVFLAEAGAMVPLCFRSQGAWVNYAMPAAVWGSILLARAVARALDTPKAGIRSLALALAALAILASDVRYAAISYSLRRDDRESIRQVLEDSVVASVPASMRYFVGMPQGNRLYGRVSLAHDEWLYQSYEALEMAESRREWLKAALTGNGPVRLVVVPSLENFEERGHVFGLPWTLPMLGYQIHQQYGKYAIWVRPAPRMETWR